MKSQAILKLLSGTLLTGGLLSLPVNAGNLGACRSCELRLNAWAIPNGPECQNCMNACAGLNENLVATYRTRCAPPPAAPKAGAAPGPAGGPGGAGPVPGGAGGAPGGPGATAPKAGAAPGPAGGHGGAGPVPGGAGGAPGGPGATAPKAGAAPGPGRPGGAGPVPGGAGGAPGGPGATAPKAGAAPGDAGGGPGGPGPVPGASTDAEFMKDKNDAADLAIASGRDAAGRVIMKCPRLLTFDDLREIRDSGQMTSARKEDRYGGLSPVVLTPQGGNTDITSAITARATDIGFGGVLLQRLYITDPSRLTCVYGFFNKARDVVTITLIEKEPQAAPPPKAAAMTEREARAALGLPVAGLLTRKQIADAWKGMARRGGSDMDKLRQAKETLQTLYPH